MSWSDLMDRAEAKANERRRLAELGAVEKHPAAAWMRWLCLGWVGGHRFYLRKRGWLMLAWLVGTLAILTPLLPNPDTGATRWRRARSGWRTPGGGPGASRAGPPSCAVRWPV